MSKRSGIILAFLYTDCSAIRKQHSPSVPPLVCFANRRSIGQPQRVTGGAAVLSSDDVEKGRSGATASPIENQPWTSMLESTRAAVIGSTTALGWYRHGRGFLQGGSRRSERLPHPMRWKHISCRTFRKACQIRWGQHETKSMEVWSQEKPRPVESQPSTECQATAVFKHDEIAASCRPVHSGPRASFVKPQLAPMGQWASLSHTDQRVLHKSGPASLTMI